MRILHIAKYVPWPADTGGKVRVRGMADILAEFAQVDLLSFESPTSPPDSQAPYGKVHVVEPPSRSGAVVGAMARVAAGLPLRASKYGTWRFVAALNNLLESVDYTAVQVEELGMMGPVLGVTTRTRPPLVYSAHNAEARLGAALMGSRGLPWSAFARTEASRTRSFEQAAVAASSGLLLVSGGDLQELGPSAAAKQHAIIPNCSSSDIAEQAPVTSGCILFVGTLGWLPNRHGIEWFLEAVLPRLRELVPSPNVVVVGKEAPKHLREKLVRTGCSLMENVTELNSIYAKARVAIVPIRFGGGTRIKIPEAWAAGVPVVSTRVGAEGLLEAEERALLIEDTPEGFAAAIASVLRDNSLYETLRGNGLALAECHSWKAWRPNMESFYDELLYSADCRT